MLVAQHETHCKMLREQEVKFDLIIKFKKFEGYSPSSNNVLKEKVEQMQSSLDDILSLLKK